MSGLLNSLLTVESLGVVLAIAYLLLAARESLWCWYCALGSSLIYIWIFWDVNLLMESALNVFYALMALLGWWEWRSGGPEHKGVAMVSLKWQQHVVLLGLMFVLAAANGWVMQNFTSAAWPFVDSFTTWASVITTFLVIRKVLENWLYWLLIDSISMWLYVDRGLYLTAGLFAAYLLIVVFGYFHWRKAYREQHDPGLAG